MRFIPAYDAEKATCLEALRTIKQMHLHFGIPGTVYIVGELLEENPTEFQEVLGSPLFEIGSHTYTHAVLREHPLQDDPAPGFEVRRHEIVDSKKLIEQIFRKPCFGFRPAYGFENGLTGDKELLELVTSAGYRYCSSQLWGPDTTLPIPFERPYFYSKDGFPGLLELPVAGYHENVLKWRSCEPHYEALWQTRMREVPGLPSAVELKTPAEEFQLYRSIINRALQLNLPYISFVWHPWSLGMFDPKMQMLRLLFQYLEEVGVTCTTFSRECARMKVPDTF